MRRTRKNFNKRFWLLGSSSELSNYLEGVKFSDIIVKKLIIARSSVVKTHIVW